MRRVPHDDPRGAPLPEPDLVGVQGTLEPIGGVF